MARTSDLSFRGAKRRGNLAVHSRITGYSRRNRNCLPEIATGAKRPRNDKLGGITRSAKPPVTCQPAWRSGNAATVKLGSMYGRRCLSHSGSAFPRLHPKGTSSRFALRAPRAQSALAMTIWGAFTILTIACTGGRCVAGRGMPRPYFFTHIGAADKCPSPRRKQADFRGKSFKKLLHSGYFSVIIRTIYSRLY